MKALPADLEKAIKAWGAGEPPNESIYAVARAIDPDVAVGTAPAGFRMVSRGAPGLALKAESRTERQTGVAMSDFPRADVERIARDVRALAARQNVRPVSVMAWINSELAAGERPAFAPQFGAPATLRSVAEVHRLLGKDAGDLSIAARAQASGEGMRMYRRLKAEQKGAA